MTPSGNNLVLDFGGGSTTTLSGDYDSDPAFFASQVERFIYSDQSVGEAVKKAADYYDFFTIITYPANNADHTATSQLNIQGSHMGIGDVPNMVIKLKNGTAYLTTTILLRTFGGVTLTVGPYTPQMGVTDLDVYYYDGSTLFFVDTGKIHVV